MGTSSGGNLAYHAGLLAGEVRDQLRRLKIKGLIMHHPFFGGSERTESELKMEHDRVLPLRASDAAWKLVLPIGADRDHEYCNPMVVDRNDAWVAMRAVDCRVLVLGCYGDPMIDRQMGLARIVEEKGVQMATHFGDGCHGLEITDPSKAPAADADPNSGVDPYQRLQLARNPDGSITRLYKCPDAPPSSDPKLPTPVLSKDIPINQSNNTWLRLFLPRHVLDHTSPTNKLPLVVYYHGGGFVLLSASSTIFHHFCSNFAADVPVIIASVEYRLAPEHRLPAAYDDAVETLHWIKTSQDDWLRDYADLSNCFLMGSSAGANIAYNAGLRVAAEGGDTLHPLKIRGLILIQPFFGGIRRTSSELRLVNDLILALSVCDLMWELSLPSGADRDHEYCNPMAAGGDSKCFDQVKALGWRVLVTGSEGDPLVDRQIEMVKMLEEKGVQVVSQFIEGGYHGAQDVEPSKAKPVFELVKPFIFP
ncbi:hypothetical protein ACLB2K_075112 [Fragaria x ananassa]